MAIWAKYTKLDWFFHNLNSNQVINLSTLLYMLRVRVYKFQYYDLSLKLNNMKTSSYVKQEAIEGS